MNLEPGPPPEMDKETQSKELEGTETEVEFGKEKQKDLQQMSIRQRRDIARLRKSVEAGTGGHECPKSNGGEIEKSIETGIQKAGSTGAHMLKSDEDEETQSKELEGTDTETEREVQFEKERQKDLQQMSIRQRRDIARLRKSMEAGTSGHEGQKSNGGEDEKSFKSETGIATENPKSSVEEGTGDSSSTRLEAVLTAKSTGKCSNQLENAFEGESNSEEIETEQAGEIVENRTTEIVPFVSEDSTIICRFCFEPSSENRPLFYPCKCSGTIQYIHQDCLKDWIKASDKPACTTCGHRFEFQKVYSPDLPEPIGIGNIFGTFFSIFSSIFAAFRIEMKLSTVLHYLFEFCVISQLVPALIVWRFRRNLYSGSGLLNFPLELISFSDIVQDMFWGFIYFNTIAGVVVWAPVFQFEKNHDHLLFRLYQEGKYNELCDMTFNFLMTCFDLLKSGGSLVPGEEKEPTALWKLILNLTQKCSYILVTLSSIFWNIKLSIGLVLVLEYFPILSGRMLIGTLDIGWLQYWIELYIGYVILTCALWFARYTWISERKKFALDYIQSFFRFMLINIFVELIHPLIISFMFDLSVKNLLKSGTATTMFTDYALWELIVYFNISKIFLTVAPTLKIILKPNLPIKLESKEETYLPIQVAVQRLGIWMLISVGFVFLLYWIPTYFLRMFLPLNLKSITPVTWNQKLQCLIFAISLDKLSSFISDNLVLQIFLSYLKSLSKPKTILFVFLKNFVFITAIISLGGVIDIFLDSFQLTDFQNTLSNGLAMLWLIYHTIQCLISFVWVIENTKFQMLKESISIVLRTLATVILLGAIPLLVGLILNKYLLIPFGIEIYKAEGVGDYWCNGLFCIQLLICIGFVPFSFLSSYTVYLLAVLMIGPQAIKVSDVVKSITLLAKIVLVPFITSEIIWSILYLSWNEHILRSSIEEVVYPMFLLFGIFLGLSKLCYGLLRTGADFVRSQYLVGDSLINLGDNKKQEIEASSPIAQETEG